MTWTTSSTAATPARVHQRPELQQEADEPGDQRHRDPVRSCGQALHEQVDVLDRLHPGQHVLDPPRADDEASAHAP
jgi:hypothetical protein